MEQSTLNGVNVFAWRGRLLVTSAEVIPLSWGEAASPSSASISVGSLELRRCSALARECFGL